MHCWHVEKRSFSLAQNWWQITALLCPLKDSSIWKLSYTSVEDSSSSNENQASKIHFDFRENLSSLRKELHHIYLWHQETGFSNPGTLSQSYVSLKFLVRLLSSEWVTDLPWSLVFLGLLNSFFVTQQEQATVKAYSSAFPAQFKRLWFHQNWEMVIGLCSS